MCWGLCQVRSRLRRDPSTDWISMRSVTQTTNMHSAKSLVKRCFLWFSSDKDSGCISAHVFAKAEDGVCLFQVQWLDKRKSEGCTYAEPHNMISFRQNSLKNLIHKWSDYNTLTKRCVAPLLDMWVWCVWLIPTVGGLKAWSFDWHKLRIIVLAKWGKSVVLDVFLRGVPCYDVGLLVKPRARPNGPPQWSAVFLLRPAWMVYGASLTSLLTNSWLSWSCSSIPKKRCWRHLVWTHG